MPIVRDESRRCDGCPAKLVGPVVDDVEPGRKRLMFVGETPGERDRAAVYTGYAGKEFNFNLLPRVVGVERPDVYVTNVCKCHEARDQRDDKVPDSRIAKCAAKWLPTEIDVIAPHVVVLMGAAACKPFRMQNGSKFDVDVHHGYVYTGYMVDEDGDRATGTLLLLPIIHPSFATHQTSMLQWTLEDFASIRRAMHGKPQLPVVDEFAGREEYIEVEHPDDLEAYLDLDDEVAADTETQEGGAPLFATFTTQPGTARFIDLRTPKLVAVLRRVLGRKHVLIHNALFDLDIFEQCRVFLEHWTDTMETAFTLQLRFQGLKNLAYRHCGMTMTSYEETLRPYANADALAWMTKALAFKRPPGKTSTRKGVKTTVYPEGDWFSKPDAYLVNGELYQPQSVGTKIGRAMTDFAKNVETDLRDRFKNWPVEQQREVIAKIGKMPPYDLTRVPRDVAVMYANRDTDATYRFWQVAKKLRRRVAKGAGLDRNDRAVRGPEYGWMTS